MIEVLSKATRSESYDEPRPAPFWTSERYDRLCGIYFGRAAIYQSLNASWYESLEVHHIYQYNSRLGFERNSDTTHSFGHITPPLRDVTHRIQKAANAHNKRLSSRGQDRLAVPKGPRFSAFTADHHPPTACITSTSRWVSIYQAYQLRRRSNIIERRGDGHISHSLVQTTTLGTSVLVSVERERHDDRRRYERYILLGTSIIKNSHQTDYRTS